MPIRPNEDLSVKISKSSGKLSAYILWLNREGRKQFFDKFGYQYNHRDLKDKDLMDEIYQSRSPDVVEYYKNLENSDINSEENKRKRREKSNSDWRAHSHSHAFRHHQATVEHKKYVESTLEQERIRRGGVVPPGTRRVYEPNTNIKKNLEIFCKRSADEIARELDILKDSFYTDPMLFVGVSTATYTFDPINGDMYPVPLEMSTILFSLQEGLQKVETVHFNLDGAAILKKNDPKEVEALKEKISRAAHHAGIPLEEAEIQSEEEMAYVWNSFKEIYAGTGRFKPRLVCEKRVLNQVKSTLRILAEAAKDLAYFNAEIPSKFIPVEILAVAMKNADKRGVDLTYGEVHQYFDNYLVPRDSYHYCDLVHQKIKAQAVRVTCQQARGAMTLHNLFAFLNEFHILNFHAFYNEKIHNLCDPYRGKTTKMMERFHVPMCDEYLDPRDVPRTGLVDGFIIVPTELEEAEVNPVEVGTILKGFPSHQPRNSGNSREVDEISPNSSDDEFAVPHFGGRFNSGPSDFGGGRRSPSPHKPGNQNSWPAPPPPENDWNSRQDHRQAYPQLPSPQFGASSSRNYPQNGSRAGNSNYYDPDDNIARNLQNTLDFDSDDERGSLRNPPRNYQNRYPSPPRSYRAPSRFAVPRYPPRCCWRSVPDSIIRSAQLWYSPQGADYDPFDED